MHEQVGVPRQVAGEAERAGRVEPLEQPVRSDDVAGRCGEVIDAAPQPGGIQQVVGVEREHVRRSAHDAKPVLRATGRPPLARLADQLDGNHGELGEQPFGDGSRVVGRVVVDDDQFRARARFAARGHDRSTASTR